MKALKKILLIIVCSFILIKIIGFFLDKGFKNYYKPVFKKMDYVFKNNSYNDIIYMGNSRTHFGINPYFIDSICKTKSYNLGFGGTDIISSVLLLQSYLIHHPPPRFVVYSYDHRIFQATLRLELAPIFFYYARYKPIREVLKRFGYHQTFLRFLPDVKFCFFNDYYRTCIVKGLAGESMNNNAVKQLPIEKYFYDYRGFINYQTNGLNMADKGDTTLPSINPESIKSFNTLIQLCRQNKIQLIFIYPPEFYKQEQLDSKKISERKIIIDSMLLSAFKKNNFYNKRFDTKDFSADDFIDPIHLNIKGSQKYSEMLGDYLRTIIK